MKTKMAIHIAEELWDSSVGATFMELLAGYGWNWENPECEENRQLVRDRGGEMKHELIAKWANIIMEHNHEEFTR